MDYVKELKKRLKDENTPGAIIGGCNVKYIIVPDNKNKYTAFYLEDLQVLLFPIENNEGLWKNFEVVEKVENINKAKGLTFIHYS